jgi:hypothetical protein
LALVVCMGTSGKGVCAEERLVPSLAIPVVTGGSPAPTQAQGLAEARTAEDPKVPYLIKELISQRFEGARLSIELAEAKVEAAQAKEISHGQAELLSALIAALRIRDRQYTTLRAETADLWQRLETAKTELERERVENRRSAAELAAEQEAANWVTIMALRNLPVARAAQIGALLASSGSAALEPAKQPSGMQTPAMGHHHPIADLTRQVRSVAHSGQNAPDDARQHLAERVIEHLEASGFEVDEADEVLRRKPRMPLHRTPGE